MSDSERLQDEVTANGKDIRQLRTEMDEMKQWRRDLVRDQSGTRNHMITWCLAILAIVTDVVWHIWGK